MAVIFSNFVQHKILDHGGLVHNICWMNTYPHNGECIKMKSAAVPSPAGDNADGDSFYDQDYKGFRMGKNNINSYDPDNFSDVSVHSDDEGRE